ncbi:MAG: glycosyltransferase [Bacteroidales bacterium]|jgi:glycosyltransferase involved in cell wall biosynthesis|nr:glycosyltransferase [Bacteroidales bacterium]
MLSILIPLYNYNAVNLVNQLHKQAKAAGIDFEILLLDDNSDSTCKRDNLILSSLSNTTLFELPTKAGRAIARNYLAGQAKYDHFLFLDCDSEPIDDLFIKRYLPYCQYQDVVVCGGTAYKPQKPKQNAYLRWRYGVKCETKSAQQRNKVPNAKFSTFNFLISRELFMSIRFNELLRNYGHEDTLFGLELQKRNHVITHIDNPLFHTGIDPNEVYLEKTRQGVKNLKILLDQYPNRDELIKNIRLLHYYNFLEKTHTTLIFFIAFRFLKKIMLANFNSVYPNLSLFNLYKLGYLCSLKYQKLIEI